MLRRVTTAVLLSAWAAGVWCGEPVKLLCSFEKDELEKKGLKIEKWKDAEPDAFIFRAGSAYGYTTPNLVRARQATEGRTALCVYYNRSYDKGGKACKEKGYPRYLWVSETCEQNAQKCQALTFYGNTRKILGGDWSGYEALWMDVFSPDGDVWLRFLIEAQDETTPYIRYHVPQGQTCTLVVPLAKYADPARRTRIDLGKIVNLLVYLDGSASEGGEVYFDNLRLAAKDAPPPAQPLPPVEEIERDWGWSELAAQHPPLKPPELKLATGPVEKLGPLTLDTGNTEWWSYLGNDGPRYYRALAAIDNQRILVVVHGKKAEASSVAFATFDGGKTWGGIDGKPGKPSELPSGQVGGIGADPQGNVYIVCNAQPKLPKPGLAADHVLLGKGPGYLDRFAPGGYCFGGGTLRCMGAWNYTFQGDHWDGQTGSIVDDFARHCVHWFDLVRVPAGRLWAFVDVGNDVFGGVHIRGLYSDDNGLTWKRSHAGRYLHPPDKAFGGFRAAAYGEHVALAGTQYYGAVWTSFDGRQWAPVDFIAKREGVAVVSLASWGKTQVKDQLVAMLKAGPKLQLCRLQAGKWESLAAAPVLDDGAKGPVSFAISTVSRDTLFCFWVRDFEKGQDGVAHSKIILRRYPFATGELGPEEELVTEQEPISALAAPHLSAPDYVPLVWCNASMSCWARYGCKSWGELQKQWGKGKKYDDWLRFLKIPN